MSLLQMILAQVSDIVSVSLYLITLVDYQTLKRAVDLTVIARRTDQVTQSSTRAHFWTTLQSRDGCCIFSGLSYTSATHIIPFAHQNDVSIVPLIILGNFTEHILVDEDPGYKP